MTETQMAVTGAINLCSFLFLMILISSFLPVWRLQTKKTKTYFVLILVNAVMCLCGGIAFLPPYPIVAHILGSVFHYALLTCYTLYILRAIEEITPVRNTAVWISASLSSLSLLLYLASLYDNMSLQLLPVNRMLYQVAQWIGVTVFAVNFLLLLRYQFYYYHFS